MVLFWYILGIVTDEVPFPQTAWQTVKGNGRFCPFPAAARCPVPMALSSPGRNRALPGMVIAGVVGRAAGDGWSVCEPQSVGHRGKGGRETGCGLTLPGTVEKAAWNSHNLIDLSNIILPKKRGLKFTLLSSSLLFSPPPQAFFWDHTVFPLVSAHSPLADFPRSLFCWPFPAITFLIYSLPSSSQYDLTLFIKPLLHLNSDHRSPQVHAALLDRAHFKINQDHTPSCTKGSPSTFQASPWREPAGFSFYIIARFSIVSFQHWCFLNSPN